MKSHKAVVVLMTCVAVILSLSACSLLPTPNLTVESTPGTPPSEVAPDDYDEYLLIADENAPLPELDWIAEQLDTDSFVKPDSNEAYALYTAIAKFHESCVLGIVGGVPQADDGDIRIVLMSRFDPYLLNDILPFPMSKLPGILSAYEEVCGPNPTTPPPLPAAEDPTMVA